MRIVIDYRPALRARTGVGEHIHEIARGLARTGADDITLFSSSWKDRLPDDLPAQMPGVRPVDCRIPVSLLNLAWHRLAWPPIERLTGRTFDVAHSPHPLLLPARSAARIVTIHDLDFLTGRNGASAEARRDYPALARAHAHLADRVIVVSRFVSGEVQRTLDVPADRISVCPNGAPRWSPRRERNPPGGYILFVGTLTPRKNLRGLLESYRRLVARDRDVPRLVIAGRPDAGDPDVLAGIDQPPLAGRVEYLGYVEDARRESLFKGASLFAFPSLDEGFGIPVLEAMAAGVPVVASNRGALPEVVGDAGLLVDPGDPDALTAAMERLLRDPALSASLTARGIERARLFTWEQTVREVRRAYDAAVLTHAHRH